jgi:integrase
VRTVNYNLEKRGRIWWFVKRVPEDVRRLFGHARVRETLKTENVLVARKRRDALLSELEKEWDRLRSLPKGRYLDERLMSEALATRKMIIEGELGPDEAKELLSDRAGDIYSEETPEELFGVVEGRASAEFYAIASGESISTADATDEFLRRANLKPSTKALYSKMLKQLGAEFVVLQEMTQPRLRVFLQRYAEARTRKAVKNLMAAGRSLLSFHGLDPDVFSGHRIDAGKDALRKEVWSDDEVVRLISAPEASQWLRDAIIVAAYGGLRRQEVCGLVYDETKDQIVVRKEKAKTASSVRRVPCHPEARASVLRLASRDAPVNPQTLTQSFQKLCGKLGLAQIIEIDGVPAKRDFHALRHTFASKLASLGVEEPVISRLLGHSRSSSATAIYARKVDPELDRRFIEMLVYTPLEIADLN